MFLIALTLAAPLAAAQPEPMTVEVVRDAITDRLSATATLRANGERIEIRCREPDWGEVSVEYHSRRWIARGNFLTGQQPVTYRFDDHAPVRRLWHVDERIAGFDNRNAVIAFVDGLLGARRLVLRTRDVENRTFDASFPIGETRSAITQLLHTCGSRRLNPRILGGE
jgi:hypothetical protein